MTLETTAQKTPTTPAEFDFPFDADYDRNRVLPRAGDEAYPHLSDLLLALEPRLAAARGAWLDFGSGTSPYRRYFGGDTMKRADLPTGDDPVSHADYVLEPGRPCPAPDAAFDGVLSTQVLEHVADPAAYLGDALRMLKPGGRLLLTTHGIWEDHPCPLDLYRWTGQGLAADLTRAGFEVEECVQVTTGVRAALLLLTQELNRVSWWGRYRGATGLALGALRLLHRRRPRAVHTFADRHLADQRVCTGGGDKLYLALLATARRPE